MRPRSLVFLTVVTLTTSACGLDAFPPRTTKLLANPTPSNSALICRPSGSNLHVFKIDDKEPPRRMARGNTFDGPFQDNYKVFLAPGPHTMEIGWGGSEEFFKEHLTLSFVVEAGHIYTVFGGRHADDGFKAEIDDMTGKSPKKAAKKKRWKRQCRWPGASYGA